MTNSITLSRSLLLVCLDEEWLEPVGLLPLGVERTSTSHN
jgi:hypothetical protein